MGYKNSENKRQNKTQRIYFTMLIVIRTLSIKRSTIPKSD